MSSQVDLAALGKIIANGYDLSIEPSVPQVDRLRLQVLADGLSERFDRLSGRWFDDQTKEFKTTSKSLKDALDAMQKPLDVIGRATAALNLLKSAMGAVDGLLKLLG